MPKSSNYDPKYIKKVDKYLKKCKDEIYDYLRLSGKTDGYEEKIKVKLPSIERFAQYIKTPRSVVYVWRDENPEFAEALDRIETEQKARLIENGLSGHYSPVISKLLLSANHGLREKSDITSGEKPLGTFNDEQIDRIAERITSRKGANGGTSSKE